MRVHYKEIPQTAIYLTFLYKMNILKNLRTAILSLSLGLGLAFFAQGASATVMPDISAPDFGASGLFGIADQNITCDEYAEHEHGYENTTRPTRGTEVYARITKMRIYLHDDFMDNVDFDSIWCSTPNGAITECADGGIDSSYGGMRVEYVENDRSADAEYENYFEWEYGTADSSESPVIAGYNDTDGDGDVDASDSDRNFSEILHFVFKDSITTGTATTSAAVWIRFAEFDQSCGDYGNASCWTYIEEDEVPGTDEYHWNTESEDLMTRYTCTGNVCEELVLTPTTTSVSDLYENVDLAVYAYNSDGDLINDDVEFHYTAEGFEGASTSAVFGDGNMFNGNEGTDYTSTDNELTYRDVQPGDSVSVEVVGSETSCYAEIVFPFCEILEIDNPVAEFFAAPGATYEEDIAITATADNGEEWPFEFVYSSTDADSTFDGDRTPLITLEKIVSYFSGDSATVNVAAEYDVAGRCNDAFTYVQTPEAAPMCEDLELGLPYESGASTCWDYSINVFGEDFSGSLVANGYEDSSMSALTTDSLTLTSDETGGSNSGNPAVLTLNTGDLRYNGTLCWPGYEETNVLSIYIKGEEALCSDTTASVEPACIDLELDPNEIAIEADEESAGRTRLTINVTGESSSFVGNLIVESDGEGELKYANGDSSEFSDGHLEIPVRGATDRATAFYIGGTEDDSVRAYVEGSERLCEDELTVTALEEDRVCYDLEISIDDNELSIEIDSDIENQTLVVEYVCEDGDEGRFAEENLDGDESLTVDFDDICNVEEVTAYIEDEEEVCKDTIAVLEEIGTLEKYIFTFNFSIEKDKYSDEDIFFSHNDDFSFWTLEYDPVGNEDEVEFRDTMWGGGSLGGTLGDGSLSGGSVTLAHPGDDGDAQTWNDYSEIKSLGLTEDNEIGSSSLGSVASSEGLYWIPYIKNIETNAVSRIYECDGDEDSDVCYSEGSSPDAGAVIIRNAGIVSEDEVIRIRYVGLVNSNLNCDDPDDDCLTELFQNTGTVETTGASVSEEANLVVLCAYLVTRNAGDVYLEENFESGTDISCIYPDESYDQDYANIEGLVILDESVSNEVDYDGSTYICESDSEGIIGNLSSYVCEIVNKVSDIWSRDVIEERTEFFVSQEIRNVDTDQNGASNMSFSDWDTLVSTLDNNNNPNSKILFYEGSGDTLTLGRLTVPEGAYTLIVENADLVLSGDITYANSTNFNNLPSVAFVVLGGDIHITTGAHELHGVFYTNQAFTGTTRSAVYDDLVIYGSVYGNIDQLLEAADYVGSPTVDGGGIVIRYDSRILLNTPPGLSDYVNVNSQKAVN
jgi:hypothetical protein